MPEARAAGRTGLAEATISSTDVPLTRPRPRLKVLAIVAMALTMAQAVCLPGVLQAAEREASGSVTKVRDGDTIVVGDIPVRFDGVSAPELDEPYGQQSRRAMSGLVAGKQVRCELTGDRSYDRWVGTCYLPDGTNLSAAIISMGLARDCPRYSGGRYRELETARSKRLTFPGYCRVR